MKKSWILVIIVLLAIVLPVGCGASTYNKLVSLDQAVQSQWAQVENVYQRRLDLVPNLVEAMFTGFPGNSGETVRISVAPEKKRG